MTLLRNRVEALETRLLAVQYRQPADYVSFKPSEKNWQWLTSQGFPLRVGIRGTKASGNGSEVSFDIGNPLAMDLGTCTIKLIWAETDSQGIAVAGTRHEDVREIEGWIPAGGYAAPDFTLEDIPPPKLGLVTVSDLNCLKLRERQ